MTETEVQGGAAAAGGLPLGRIVAGIAALAGLILLGRAAGGYVPAFADWVDGLGVLGPVVFIVGYAVAVVAFVPASLLTLAAGAIFGLGPGTVYVFLAATLGSSLAFLVSRYLAREAVEKRVAGNARFAAIDRAVGEQGRKIVFLLRLSPAFPYNLLNYALGLTRVPLLQYVLASVGMLPGTFLYVYYGKAIGSLSAIAAGEAPEQGGEQWVFLAVGLIATIAVTAFVTKIARRALAEAADV